MTTRIRVLPEGVNNDGSASLASFGNPLKPAMPKSALPMRRTAKTPVIWLPKLHLLLGRQRVRSTSSTGFFVHTIMAAHTGKSRLAPSVPAVVQS